MFIYFKKGFIIKKKHESNNDLFLIQAVSSRCDDIIINLI